MLRLTPVVKNIIIINVIVFFAGMLAPRVDISACFGHAHAGSQDAITAFLALFNTSTPCFKPYQLFTYMFVHGSFFHILFNMMALAFLGPMIESFWGFKRFLLFYIITGIGAAVFNILMGFVFPGGSFGLMVGASGAVYGVLAAFGILFPNMELRLLFPPIPVKAKHLVLVLGGIAIYSGFMGNPGDNTAHFAHLGGIVVAFIMIMIWRKQ
jgi:membrane associated rhomboid family serine protease